MSLTNTFKNGSYVYFWIVTLVSSCCKSCGIASDKFCIELERVFVCRTLLSWLFCCLAILYPRVGQTMDVLSPFISVLHRSDWLFHRESCRRLDVVYPGRAWSPACTWHCSLSRLQNLIWPVLLSVCLRQNLKNGCIRATELSSTITARGPWRSRCHDATDNFEATRVVATLASGHVIVAIMSVTHGSVSTLAEKLISEEICCLWRLTPFHFISVCLCARCCYHGCRIPISPVLTEPQHFR